MPRKGKGGSPKEENGKNDSKQQMIGNLLKMLIAYVLSCLKWNKDKKEGKPAISITEETQRNADKNVYRIAVRSDASQSLGEVEDNLMSMMTTAPKAMEKAESKGHDPIYGLVMSILHKLQRLDRYNTMKIVEDGLNCITVVLPKQIHLNFTAKDLNKQLRMAQRLGHREPKKKVQANVEANLTMQLVALTGEIKVGMKKDAPAIIVVYAPQGDNTSFHNIKLVASMTIVNTEMKWSPGKREHRAFKGKKEVPASTINKMLTKAKFTLKGENKIFQIAFNRKTSSHDWNKAAEGLELAKAAGAIADNIKFKRVWTQDGNAPVQDIGFGTVAGILSSMTNGTTKGKTNHIKVEALRKSFVNISLKRLLAAHPDEMGLLNEDNQNLTHQLRDLLGLATYKMPAVVTTEKENWSFKNKDDLNSLLQSGVIKAYRDDDVNALLSASKVEPVAHAELNRWWNHTGCTHAVQECEFTVADDGHTMLDIVYAETDKAAPKTQ
jgi:hypothetical protein